MKNLLLIVAALLLLTCCGEQTLDPDAYDKTCEVDSDCLTYPSDCSFCHTFAANANSTQSVEDDLQKLSCEALFVGGGTPSCLYAETECVENTCRFYTR